MINKFAGKCVECGTFCKAGTANWFAGHGVVCDRCNGFDSVAATKADPHSYSVPAPVVVVAPVISEEEKRAAEIKRVESALEVNRRMVRMMRESGREYAPIAYEGYERQIAKLEAELAALQPVVVVEEEIVTEAELAAAEAEVEAVETAEAAEIAAMEDAIEIAPVVVAQTTLRLYRMTVLCKTCFMRTKAAAKEITHHAWCHTREQSPELLRTLQDKIAASRIKRRETKAAKLNAKIDELREAYSAVYASVGGNSALGIHKISGSTGLHTVRAYEGTCTCPGHKAHGHCKHVRLVRDARDAMQSIKRQLRDTSDRLLAMAERATQANCEW